MGWRQNLKIWMASCMLAAVSGVAIGLVSVGVARHYRAASASAVALPAPGESRPGRAAPPAGHPAESAGTLVTPVTRSTGTTVRTGPAKAASAKQHASDVKKKDGSATDAKAESGSEPSGKSKTKEAKPKSRSGK
ncbi:MAG TPA: hypothetical protein VI357_19295 [Mycobacteriales bacterium]